MAIFGGEGGLTCMENKKLSMSLYNYKRLNNTSNNLKINKRKEETMLANATNQQYKKLQTTR